MGVLGSSQSPPSPTSSPAPGQAGLSDTQPLTIAGLAVTVQGEALMAGTGIGARRADTQLLTIVVPCGTQVRHYWGEKRRLRYQSHSQMLGHLGQNASL